MDSALIAAVSRALAVHSWARRNFRRLIDYAAIS